MRAHKGSRFVNTGRIDARVAGMGALEIGGVSEILPVEKGLEAGGQNIIVEAIHFHRKADLLEVVPAHRRPSRLAGSGKRRHEHCCGATSEDHRNGAYGDRGYGERRPSEGALRGVDAQERDDAEDKADEAERRQDEAAEHQGSDGEARRARRSGLLDADRLL
jgi:hypothetical protein